MRRSDREITDKAQIEQFIASEQILRLAFYDHGDIYLVPVNYGYTCVNGCYSFYFHGAKTGRKYELSLCRPSVGFEIDGKYALLPHALPCQYSAAFQSVVGTGIIHIVEDTDEKIEGLACIMKQATEIDDWDFAKKGLDAVAVFRLDAVSLSCKAHCP